MGKYECFDICGNEVEFSNSLFEYISEYNPDDIVFICVGSMRAFGDSVAPRIGSKLKKLGINNVYGTEDSPIHAKNLDDAITYIKKKHEYATIIAIDACLGCQSTSIGNVQLTNSPLRAGAGVGKQLQVIGDITVACIVDVSDNYQGSSTEQYRAFERVDRNLINNFIEYVASGIANVIMSETLETNKSAIY